MIDLCIPVQMIDLKLIEEKAISILTECDTAMLASVTQEGYPRPVPMGKIKRMVFPKYGSLQARSLIRQYNSNSTRKPEFAL